MISIYTHFINSHLFCQGILPPAKRKSFLEKGKGQSGTSPPVSEIFCEVFNSKHLDLRSAHIRDGSTEHLFTKNPLNVPKPNSKHPDVRGGGHPRKLHVNRLEITEFEPCVFFRFSFPTLHSTMHEVCYFSDPFVIWRSSVEQWKTNSAGEFSTCLVSFSSLGA